MSTENHGDDVATTDPVIAALLRERQGYVVRKLPERVEAVDEQLRLRGHVVDEGQADGGEGDQGTGGEGADSTPPAAAKSATARKQTR
jgi:hypothetical protein